MEELEVRLGLVAACYVVVVQVVLWVLAYWLRTVVLAWSPARACRTCGGAACRECGMEVK